MMFASRLPRCLWYCLGLPLVGGAILPAAPPQVTVIRPLGVQPGQTVELRTNGANLAGARQCWTSFAGTVPVAEGIEGNGTDGGTTLYRLEVPADAPLGVHGLRVVTEGGVSPLRLMLVDDLPTVSKAGGNTSLAAAQEVSVPVGIDGHVDGLTRDFYRFKAEAGQTLTLEIWARRLGSPLDPVLFLYRADGKQLQYVDDTPGLSSDAQLVHTFAETSEYVVEVRDSQYLGGGNHFYRLRIGDFPALSSPVPAGAQRGVENRIDFAGKEAAVAVPQTVVVSAEAPDQWRRVATTRVGGSTHAFVSLPVGEQAEYLEREPNDASEQANRVELPQHLNGRIDRQGDIDRFVFTAKAGDRFVFRGMTRELNTPTDLFLRILKPDGGQLAAVDDTAGGEGVLSPALPADGDYILEVRDVNFRGGAEFAYRVAVERFSPQIELELGLEALSVPAGNVLAVPVNVTRTEFGGEVELSVKGLPEGVSATPVVIGPGLNTGVLTLEAAAEFPAGQLHQLRIIGTIRQGDAVTQRVATVRNTQRGLWNNTVFSAGPLADSVALAAAPAQKLRLRFEPAQLQFKRGEKPTVKLIAERGEGVEEAIALVVNPEKNAFPGNLNLPPKNIEKGQSEVELQFDSNDQTPLGRFSVVFTGTHKQGNDTIVVSTPALTFQVTE